MIISSHSSCCLTMYLFRSLVKSFVVFGAAIFVAREYVAMEAEDMAAQAAEKMPAV